MENLNFRAISSSKVQVIKVQKLLGHPVLQGKSFWFKVHFEFSRSISEFKLGFKPTLMPLDSTGRLVSPLFGGHGGNRANIFR